MGRGLSELQQNILRMALATYQQPKPKDWTSTVDVYEVEILVLCYGFHPVKTSAWVEPTGRWPLRGWRGHLAQPQVFSAEIEGKERYNVARAAVARAIRRLEARGLITQNGRGVRLTYEGVRVAEELSAK